MSSRKNRRIAFITPYKDGISPGQRFRFEQYYDLLADKFEILKLPFFNEESILKNSSPSNLLAVVSLGIIKRFFQLRKILGVNYVFIFREASPIGPPLFEWIISRVLGKKIIYDFDDAIWLTDKKDEHFFERIIRWRNKVSSICLWSYKVSCGNEYLKQYALQFNAKSILNPTTIDTLKVHNPVLQETVKNKERLVIGWTGSYSTLKYLYLLENVLQQIQKKFYNVDLLVIADIPPQIKLDRVIFKMWSPENEVKDLLMCDIGIMPLPNDEWSKGKCGFKALQYMALEIPAVCSPVGVNIEIIDHKKNGFLSRSPKEWLLILEKLILDSNLRKQIGKAGRKTVIDRYSVITNANNFLSLFR